jgi:gluconolactonase
MAGFEVRDPRLHSVVSATAELKRVATGFMFTEGPLWHPTQKFLLFSDMPGNIIRRWTPTGGVTPFRQPSNMANGLTYDREGRLLACEHSTSRVTRTEPDGSITALATHWDCKELNSPNDIVVDRAGAIYFTDPIYGRVEYYGVPREPELSFRGVYRIDPKDGNLALLADDFSQPNGLCFSLDEKQLFVNDTERSHIRVFDVSPDGKLTSSRVFAETTGEGEGAPDGMKIDSVGNLLCCAQGGVHVFDLSGVCLGVIRVPEPAANLTWGADDLRTLFVTASSSLYRIAVEVPGRPVF